MAAPCAVQTPRRVIICGGLGGPWGVSVWARGAEGALKRKACQSHSRLMLSESERSCHVFWQLTRLVWILQHKAGTVLRACVYFCTFAGKRAPGLFSALTLLPCTVTERHITRCSLSPNTRTVHIQILYLTLLCMVH